MYREWDPPAALRPWLACVWVRETAPGGETLPVLPDACMDLMWRDGTLKVAGPDTVVNLSPLEPGGRIVGVRFRPGTALPILGVEASQLTDQRVDLSDLGGRAAHELGAGARVGEASSLRAIAGELLAAVAERAVAAPRPDPVVQAVVAACDGAGGPLAVGRLSRELGVSDRQLRRRSVAALGYGPKTLDRIVRFQRFLRLAGAAPPGRLAVVAAEAGYADQAHLTRECQRLAGVSPAVLLARRAA